MSPSFDAVVVGGGAAGLSAALTLGRSCRRVLLATSGPPRNAPAEAVHNVFTRDGTPPAELVRIGLDQLAPYDVTVRHEAVTDAETTDAGVAVTFAGGERVAARGLVLATGVRDVLPEVPGLAERWGTGVFHCPYCHGWEVAGRPLAVLARDGAALHLGRLLRGWTDDLVVFTNGPDGIEAEERARFERNGVAVREEPVEQLAGADGRLEAVVLAGGERVARAGLFVGPEQALRSDLAHRLGCPLTEAGRVAVDVGGRTSVPGVYAAGDLATAMQAVPTAAASGMMAGAMLNHDLLEADFVA